jgi:hypothetical protein
MTDTQSSALTAGRPVLPTWLDRYTTYGLYGLVAGTVLALVAFLTNPVPDPSFPWATLPSSLRVPVHQPRIEHWPVTYTLGIWLWIAGFPALVLGAHRRWGRRFAVDRAVWFVGLPTAATLAWTTYCRFFWPKLQPPTWNAPSYTLVCWLYCSSYVRLWSDLAYVVAALGAVATVLAVWRWQRAAVLAVAFGVLSFPLGLPAAYEGYRSVKQ